MLYAANYSDFQKFLHNHFISIKRNQRTGRFDLVIKINGEIFKFHGDYYGDVIRLAINFINSRVL